jgi:hypothetical protein
VTRLFEKEYGLPVNSNPTDPRSRVRRIWSAPSRDADNSADIGKLKFQGCLLLCTASEI